MGGGHGGDSWLVRWLKRVYEPTLAWALEARLKILGISGLHHGSAACVVDDGIIVAAAEEERFSRKRDDRAFPVASIAYCLEEAAVESGAEIDIIVFHENSVTPKQCTV